MEIKKYLGISTGDFWYDLTDSGYLKPEAICAKSEDAEKVNDAIEVIRDFETSCLIEIENFIQ